MKRALVFGVTGQDGSYLAELLLSKGYDVVGVSRRTSTPNDGRVRHLLGRNDFRLVRGDVTDALCVQRLVAEHDPWRARSGIGVPPYIDMRYEIYNLAAQSHVGVSFEEPSHTWAATAGGALNILESIRSLPGMKKYTRFYQASSSEMFGSAYSVRDGGPRVPGMNVRLEMYQDEGTPMLPNSPYAVAKLAAHHLCRVYRESYGIYAASGILFNHESERRGEEFVTRKIARYVAWYAWAREHSQAVETLKLGNLEARRDWGYAGDYVRAMWLMLQQDEPDDFVVATGDTHSVREFLYAAFAAVGEPLVVADAAVECDPALMRPCEVPYLRGDAGKAKRVLGWTPEVTFEGLVRRMVLYEMKSLPS